LLTGKRPRRKDVTLVHFRRFFPILVLCERVVRYRVLLPMLVIK
jgi:hypothetical protein